MATLSDQERADPRARCREPLEKFKAARGAAIWEHRTPGLGIIPGRLRYETLETPCGRDPDVSGFNVGINCGEAAREPHATFGTELSWHCSRRPHGLGNVDVLYRCGGRTGLVHQ